MHQPVASRYAASPGTSVWLRPVLIYLLVLLALPAALRAAEEPVKQNEYQPMLEKLKLIESDTKSPTTAFNTLTGYNKDLAGFKLIAQKCIDLSQEALNKVTADVEKLGEKKKKESAEVVKQRKQIEAERAAIEAKLQECNALNIRIQSLQENLDAVIKQELEARMLARGPDIFAVIKTNLKEPVKWFSSSFDYASKNSWLFNKASDSEINWLIGSFVFGALLGGLLRWRGLAAVARRPWSDSTGGRFASSVLATFCKEAPFVLSLVAIATCMAILTSEIQPRPVMAIVSYALTALFVARLLIRISLDPVPPGQLFLRVPPTVARQLSYRMQVLMVLAMLGYLLIETLFWASLPDFARSLARTVVRILLAINIVWVLWLFQHLTGTLCRGWFRYSLSVVLVIAVLADLSGYSNFSGWLFRSVFGTLMAFSITFTILRLNKELFLSLEYARTPGQQRVRKLLGLPVEGHLAFFFWLRVLVSTGLWLLLGWLLLLIWDVSTNAVQQMNTYLQDGFMVGELRIVPSRVLFAAITMAILIALTSWGKGLMKTQLESSPMERGTREAMITMTGYVGVLIAIFVSLGMAGINFQNIALIAGALSVGIGFGLQNIVNNFISGLILLFERPIKTGDWIVVGNTEGYVKRIRIRSTQIQTFDRADVIVPNSELISGQVTNWMLSDTTGRARIPIGVAYGTDVHKVKSILLQIAEDHPDVLTDGSAPAPFVLFRQFGDSSLDFELRCHIRNIDNRLRVISDINFAIDKAFREEGITIPFPQRDVHLYDTRTPPAES